MRTSTVAAVECCYWWEDIASPNIQVWTMSAVLLNMIAQGMQLSFSSCLLPALLSPDSDIKTELNTASWISSSMGISGIIGFPLSAILMEIYGRRKAHLIIMIPGVVSLLLMYFATDVPTLIIGRILGGITSGASATLAAVVTGEYTTPKYRGMFLNLKTAAVSMGGMTVHILSQFYHWKTIALYGLVIHFITIAIVYTWSESPSWLLAKQQYENSEKAFYWLRGKNEESCRELEKMIKAHMQRTSKQFQKQTTMEQMKDFLQKFTKKDFLKPLCIASTGTALLELSGRHYFPAYAFQFIGQITDSKSQSFYYIFVIDIIITMSAVCSSILVKVINRRTLLFSTGFSAFFVLAVVCTYLVLSARDFITKDYPWIPMSLFVIYFILANLGCTPIPLALLGELYPLDHRGAGLALSGICISIILMLVLHLTPHFLISIQAHGTLTVYGIGMGISLVILYFTLPETKDRTLQEIEDYFNHGKFSENIDNDDEEANVKMITET